MKKMVFITVLILVTGRGFCDVQDLSLENLDQDSREKIQQLLNRAEELDLPVKMLERKIMEGLAKERSGAEIAGALEARLKNMEKAAEAKGDEKDLSRALFKLEAAPPESGSEEEPQISGAGGTGKPDAMEKKQETQEKVFDKKKEKQEKLDESLEMKQDKLEKVLGAKQKKLEQRLEKQSEMLEKKLEKKMDALERGKGKSGK